MLLGHGRRGPGHLNYETGHNAAENPGLKSCSVRHLLLLLLSLSFDFPALCYRCPRQNLDVK